jgi:hypothetical protein
MSGQLLVVLVLLVLAALFAIVNPESLAQHSAFTAFGRRYDGPVLAVMQVGAAATWVLLLLLGALNEWRWRRRAHALTAELQASREEITRLRANAYERQQPASGG